jgi:integrase
LFIETKLVAGCRTLDLCKARSEDLDGTRLTITAQASKTREARVVPLPAALAQKLHRSKGPTWLWECSVDESKEHRSASPLCAQGFHLAFMGRFHYITARAYSPWRINWVGSLCLPWR